MNPIDFLNAVWNQQQFRGDAYTFLCMRREMSWDEIPVKLPLSKSIPRRIEENGADIYFCPNIFSKPHRRKEFMLPSIWLYADLDDCDPYAIEEQYDPSVAWESSPSRYQCLWLLPKPLEPKVHQAINRRLTYYLSADPSGWDATQVLRVPGTVNHKYPSSPLVTLLWYSHDVLKRSPSPVAADYEGHSAIPSLSSNGDSSSRLTARQLRRKHSDRIPLNIRTKLLARTATGDRSKVLFRLETTLLERGLHQDDVFILLRDTVWNKFSDKRLMEDIARAASRV